MRKFKGSAKVEHSHSIVPSLPSENKDLVITSKLQERKNNHKATIKLSIEILLEDLHSVEVLLP